MLTVMSRVVKQEELLGDSHEINWGDSRNIGGTSEEVGCFKYCTRYSTTSLIVHQYSGKPSQVAQRVKNT